MGRGDETALVFRDCRHRRIRGRLRLYGCCTDSFRHRLCETGKVAMEHGYQGAIRMMLAIWVLAAFLFFRCIVTLVAFLVCLKREISYGKWARGHQRKANKGRRVNF